MAAYYYLISSLPMLKPLEDTPFNSEEFAALCAEWLGGREMAVLASTSLVPDGGKAPAGSLAAKWKDWETCLRNRIAKQRVSVNKTDAAPFIRPGGGFYSEIESGVQNAFAKGTPLEREETLDRLRWRAVEDFETGHIFDLDRLCAYKLRLAINAKWRGRSIEPGRDNFESIISAVEKGGETAGNGVGVVQTK